jgi:hypothetical protein
METFKYSIANQIFEPYLCTLIKETEPKTFEKVAYYILEHSFSQLLVTLFKIN